MDIRMEDVCEIIKQMGIKIKKYIEDIIWELKHERFHHAEDKAVALKMLAEEIRDLVLMFKRYFYIRHEYLKSGKGGRSDA